MKTENTKPQIRKRILECCILLELENKPLYVSDIINNIQKSKISAEKQTRYPMLPQPKDKGFLGHRVENSDTSETSNKVHLMWLWSGYLNVTQSKI